MYERTSNEELPRRRVLLDSKQMHKSQRRIDINEEREVNNNHTDNECTTLENRFIYHLEERYYKEMVMSKGNMETN